MSYEPTIRPLEQINAWFKKGFYPKAVQFWDTFFSFWHKNDKIPMDSIDGLHNSLNNKYDKSDGVALEGRVDEAEGRLDDYDNRIDNVYKNLSDHKERLDGHDDDFAGLRDNIGEIETKVGQNTQDIAGIQESLAGKEHFRGYCITNAEVLALPNPEARDYAYSAESSTKWIYSGTLWADSGIPVPDQTVPPSDAIPLMDGAGFVGTANEYSRGDHRHPTDTTRAADNAVVKLSGAQTIADVKTFTSSPIVPTPTVDMAVATKKYVDEKAGSGGSDGPYVKYSPSTNFLIYNGASGGNLVTTAQFIQFLIDGGAFNKQYWFTRGSYGLSYNDVISDSGFGQIALIGALVEVFSETSTRYTIRITTSNNSGSSSFIKNTTFVYTKNDTYDNWARLGAWDGNSYITTNTAQTVSGVKTFTALPIASIIPTDDRHFVNKAYVDAANKMPVYTVSSSNIGAAANAITNYTGTINPSVNLTTPPDGKAMQAGDTSVLVMNGNLTPSFTTGTRKLQDGYSDISGNSSDKMVYTILFIGGVYIINRSLYK